METRFTQWCETVAGRPRRQTRVLTWPLVTVWGFIAQPEQHIFLKPNATKLAAQKYGFEFRTNRSRLTGRPTSISSSSPKPCDVIRAIFAHAT